MVGEGGVETHQVSCGQPAVKDHEYQRTGQFDYDRGGSHVAERKEKTEKIRSDNH